MRGIEDGTSEDPSRRADVLNLLGDLKLFPHMLVGHSFGGKKSTLVSYLENRGFSKDISRAGGTNRFTSSSTCTSGAATGSASITADDLVCETRDQKHGPRIHEVQDDGPKERWTWSNPGDAHTKTERDWETILTSKTE
eukprot:jgi/Pico_ML_1/55408/g1096.t2